jgi:hypothetical protein
MTSKFGWLQASATKVSSLSITSANPATIRIVGNFFQADVWGAYLQPKEVARCESGRFRQITRANFSSRQNVSFFDLRRNSLQVFSILASKADIELR